MLLLELSMVQVESDQHRILHHGAHLAFALFIASMDYLILVEFPQEILELFGLDELVLDGEE